MTGIGGADMLKTTPAVFAVGENYQIMVPVSCETLMSVRIGGERYYDESNGILRSDVVVHRMTVPQKELDREKKYTVCVRKIIERKPYFTETEEEEEYTFDFKPVPKENATAYHIADTHNMIEPPVLAALAYGDIDFLILNGDIPDHSGKPENILTVYEIAARITKGRIPVVFARGNHDMRGIYADRFCDLVGSDNGLSYYTFRLGSIWGMVLDCGEDKDDSHPAYGHTICCNAFRKRQTAFIERVIEQKEKEYEAQGVLSKIIVCHIPFTEVRMPPHDIEKEIYSTWAKLLRENIKPDMMLCGHLHRIEVNNPGGEKDHLGQPCTVVIGAEPWLEPGAERFAGMGFRFEKGNIDALITNSAGEQLETYRIK